jgi:hypothetical protein
MPAGVDLDGVPVAQQASDGVRGTGTAAAATLVR